MVSSHSKYLQVCDARCINEWQIKVFYEHAVQSLQELTLEYEEKFLAEQVSDSHLQSPTARILPCHVLIADRSQGARKTEGASHGWSALSHDAANLMYGVLSFRVVSC